MTSEGASSPILAFVRSGTNRNVLLIGRFAIKFPKLWPPRRTRKALRANRLEHRLSRNLDLPELCPVLALLPFGVAIVMPRARMMTIDEYLAFAESDAWPLRRAAPYEDKLGDWGYFNGRPVVVDYAVQVHEDEFAEQIRRARRAGAED